MLCDCRQDGQGSSGDLKGRDFRRDLDERERAARDKRTERDYSSSSSSKRARIEHAPSSHLDDDDPIDQVYQLCDLDCQYLCIDF